MNCRVVEKGHFSKPEVAKILRKKFIEARLHTDKSNSPFFDRIIQLRDKYVGVGDGGLPVYFILDPNDLDNPIRSRRGAPGVPELIEFLTGKSS